MATTEDRIPLTLLPAEVPMTEEEENELVKYLEEELTQAEFSRSDRMERLKELDEVYRAPKEENEKNFPFKRASNIKIPIAKTVVNVIAPRIIDELFRTSPIWTFRSEHTNEVFTRVSAHTEDFFQQYAERRIRAEEKFENMILEGTKLGTGYIEVSMAFDRRRTARYGRDGVTIEVDEQDVNFGPDIFNVPNEDLWYPYGYTDPQQMPWIGKALHFTEREVRDRVDNGKFRQEPLGKVLGSPTLLPAHPNRPITEQREEHEKTEPSFGTVKQYDIFEIYAYWPIRVETENGEEKVTADLLLYYHRETRSLLRVQLNPWWHQKRPYLYWPYTPIEYRFAGEGAVEQVEQFQAEIQSLHRLRLDNATLANMRMILVSRVVEGLKPGDPLYPGKVLKVTSPDDVVPFQLTDIYPSTVLNENLSMQLMERVSGINEATLGAALPVPRTTATAQVSMIEQQQQRFRLTIKRARRVIEDAGGMLYDLFHQYGTGGLAHEWLGTDRGELVETLFTFPRERVSRGITLRVKATSPSINKGLEMQSNIQLFNLMIQLHQQILQLVAGLDQRFIPLVAHGLISSAKKFMTRVLETFDVADPEDTLQALTILERVLPAAENLGGQAPLEEQLQQLRAEIGGLDAGIRGEVGAGLSAQIQRVEDTVQQVRAAQNGGTGMGSRFPGIR